MAKKSKPTFHLTATLWTIVVVILLLSVLHRIFYDSTAVTSRSLLMTGAILFPTAVLFIRAEWGWSEIVGAKPDAIVIALGGLLGLVIWPIAWWVMSFIDEEVFFELFGSFSQPDLYQPQNWEDVWTWLILTDVVFVPFALLILLWGILRWHLMDIKAWQGGLVMGVILGVLGVYLFGQGMVGFFGYGLCGLVAGYIGRLSGSAWAGFATHATFMYANLNFLDNLLSQVVKRLEEGGVKPEPYFGTKWLSLVLIAGLIAIAIIQVIRFRTEKRTKPPTQKFTLSWLPIGVIMTIFIFSFIEEMGRRGS